MFRLSLGFARELLPRWWQVGFLLTVFVAASLSFDSSLGAHSLGTYLAYTSILPVVLLLRCGSVLQRRSQEGWPLEEILRDADGRKAPFAELGACLLLLVEVLVLAAAPVALEIFPAPQASSGLFPVHVQRGDNNTWLFDLGRRVPPGARLQLTLDWSQVENPLAELWLEAPDHRQQKCVAGELLRWDLSPQEALYGKLVLQPHPTAGVALRAPLSRLEIPRPTGKDLPRLLFSQFLFFAPLFAILLAWFRYGRVHGVLSALTSITLGSLATMQVQPMNLGSGLGASLAKMLVLLKISLPPVEGLLATGQGFERLAYTTSNASISGWLGLGALALWLACRRRPPSPR